MPYDKAFSHEKYIEDVLSDSGRAPNETRGNECI